jgi:hypothetical protein
MSPTDAPFQKIPLVFTSPGSPVHDLIAAMRDEESDELSRSLWADFRQDLLRRLDSIAERELDPKQLREELHSIRGSSAQFGLFLLEIFLFAWEKKEEDPVGAAFKYLPGSLVIARLSLEAIEKDFPHLRSPLG